MLAELSRREKAANLKPDPDLDVYMKVSEQQQKIKTLSTCEKLGAILSL